MYEREQCAPELELPCWWQARTSTFDFSIDVVLFERTATIGM
jgi:hypothetical protein